MSYLIFCSFEVGGFPYKMAEILNRHGIKTYYLSLAEQSNGHDSTVFHYGVQSKEWDISHEFRIFSTVKDVIAQLQRVCVTYGITHCLATGRKSFLLQKAGIQYYYWSTGADLDEDCFAPGWPNDYSLKTMVKRWLYYSLYFRPEARRSLCGSKGLMIAPYQYDAYQRLCPKKQLFFLPHYYYIDEYEKLLIKKKEESARICKKIGTSGYFFSSTRHLWAGRHRHRADYKGNEILLRAFALFQKESNVERKLLLIEKGPDVVFSKKLIHQLDIENNVYWLKEMKREDLLQYYQGATICIGQFGSNVLTNTVIEPLSQGTPCISYIDQNSIKVPYYDTFPPINITKNVGEIAQLFMKVTKSPTYCSSWGRVSWEWVRDHCSEAIFVDAFKKNILT